MNPKRKASLTFSRKLAKYITRYRKENGLTQREFAQKVGCSQPAIARLESGIHVPSVETLARITLFTNIQYQIQFRGGNIILKENIID